jgi:hypothetical protein
VVAMGEGVRKETGLLGVGRGRTERRWAMS